MTISYRLDFAEDYARRHRKAWTLHRLVEGTLSDRPDGNLQYGRPAAAKRLESLGSYSTLREVIDAVAQDKAKHIPNFSTS
jgi:hypothetical protein